MYTAKTLSISGMTCPSCVNHIEGELNSMDGIQSATVNFEAKTLDVSYDTKLIKLDTITKRMKEIGYPAKSKESATASTPKPKFKFQKVRLAPKQALLMAISAVLPIFIIFSLFSVQLTMRPMVAGMIYDHQLIAQGEDLEQIVLPAEGYNLGVNWGNLGQKMTQAGVINQPAFEALYAKRGGLSKAQQQLLSGVSSGELSVTPENSNLLLNLLWALGLSNKNSILDTGPMQNPEYGGANRFAATGGWSLAKGDPMQYYSRYSFVPLTGEQQSLVEVVSKSIYRPCCGNSTHFPDCNHGMAMLGLLQLMASQGASEADMYDAALQVNSYWFPTQYQTIASYFQMQDTPWSEVAAKDVLGQAFSSSSGYRYILSLVEPPESGGGVSCGV
jgi:copper chaperone CopZ